MSLPLHELVHRAEQLKELFEGTYERWENMGAIRRQDRGMTVECLAIARFGPRGENLVWQRVEQLAKPVGQQIQQCNFPLVGIDPEIKLVAFDRQAVHHRLALATFFNWGMRMAQWTGPEVYWQMLFARLHHEGTLKVHAGNVCHVNRESGQAKLDPIECQEEKEFFRLARTLWIEPKFRMAPKDGRFLDGMQPPYLPDFLKPYACPEKHPELFRQGASGRRRKKP